jgi:hypothetical protein
MQSNLSASIGRCCFISCSNSFLQDWNLCSVAQHRSPFSARFPRVLSVFYSTSIFLVLFLLETRSRHRHSLCSIFFTGPESILLRVFLPCRSQDSVSSSCDRHFGLIHFAQDFNSCLQFPTVLALVRLPLLSGQYDLFCPRMESRLVLVFLC